MNINKPQITAAVKAKAMHTFPQVQDHVKLAFADKVAVKANDVIIHT